MNKNITSFSLIRKLYSHVDSEGKKKLLWMFFLSIIASFAEIFSIGMLIPFIGIMIDQDFVLEKIKYYQIMFICFLKMICYFI